MSVADINVISDQDALNAFCDTLKSETVIFVDTEFHRESTYWPKLCLIQAAGAHDEAIIDPLANGLDLTPFLKLLADSDILKVFHAARQDMEIFALLMDAPPAPIFDTQIASMAIGLGDSISFDNMVSQLTKESIDKSSQFTDWTHRPLTAKQLHYALGDVTHLRAAYEVMERRLNAHNRWGWLEEDMKAQSDPDLYASDPQNAWKRLKLRRNRKDYLAVLKMVAIWREETAQSQNRPRNRILKDDAIQEIADQRPKDAKALERLRSVPKGFAGSRHGGPLLSTINHALDNAEDLAPQIDKPRQRNPSPPGASDLLRVLLKQICDNAQVTPRLIANSADLERVAAGEGEETDVMKNWRYDLFGRYAEDLLNGRLAITFKEGDVKMFDVPTDLQN